MAVQHDISLSRRESGKKTVYAKEQHPHYFGHFINQGRHNAYMIMADLAERFEVAVAEEEQLVGAPLLKLLDEAKRPDETARLVQALTRQFTFLRYLSLDETGKPTRDVRPQDVKKVLQGAFEVLRLLRNEYSHHGSKKTGLWVLSNLKNYTFPLSSIYQSAIHGLRARFGHYTEAHIAALLPTAENAGEVPNDPATATYNHQALVFFTCFFLERDEASRFFGRLEAFNDTTSLSRRAKLDAYREFCCRLPQPKLESSDILLDMFNELGRCPKALYPLLSEADRQQFDRTPEPDEYQETEDMLPSVLVRHNDRIPWFVLRYFDDRRVFPNLRFHLHLGQFATRRYDKEMNQEQRERVWLRPLRVFARWQQVDVTDLRRRTEALKDDKAKSLEYQKSLPPSWLTNDRGIFKLRPEIEQFSTSYLLDNQCIGFRFLKEGEREPGFPDLPLTPNQEGQFIFPAADQPDAILSAYELSALFLHQHLYGATQTETFLKNYIKCFRKVCLDLKTGVLLPQQTKPEVEKTAGKAPKNKKEQQKADANARLREERSIAMDAHLQATYSIALRDLPDVFRTFLLGYRRDTYRYAALEKLKTKRKETRYLLKDLGYIEEKNGLVYPDKPEKNEAPKSGEMGSWLAADMVFLKPADADGRGKPNDAQYNILQKMLAYFGGYRDQLSPYFEELGLTGKDAVAPHPFLKKVDLSRCRGILDFYRLYLEARYAFLERIILEIDPYFGKKPPKKRDKQGLAEDQIREKYGHFIPIREKTAIEKDYSRQAILLPRGLFNASNEAKLRELGKLRPEDKSANMILGLERYAEGATQPMYELPRFVLPPGETGKRGDPVPLQERLETLRAPAKRESEDEKKSRLKEEGRILDSLQAIRYHQALDRALWYMALERAKQKEDWDIDFSVMTLRDMEAVLTHEIPFHWSIGQVTLDATLTIRRYGELRRLLKDRRLSKLMAYFTDATHIRHEEVIIAFDEYERRRIPFFERIFVFEKTIFEHFEVDVIAHMEGQGRDYLSHWDYLRPAFAKLTNASQLGIDVNKLGELRDKLLHNEIPLPELLPVTVDTSSCQAIITDVFNKVEGYYARLLRLLGLPS